MPTKRSQNTVSKKPPADTTFPYGLSTEVKIKKHGTAFKTVNIFGNFQYHHTVMPADLGAKSFEQNTTDRNSSGRKISIGFSI